MSNKVTIPGFALFAPLPVQPVAKSVTADTLVTDLPAAPISGTDPAPTAPVAALEPAPTKPEPESTEAFWRRIVGAAPETPANRPESIREAEPAPETGNHALDNGDRARAILGCEEAKRRRRLAEHILCHTDLDADAARAALAAAPIETKAAPAPTPKPAPAPATRPTEPLAPATSQDWARQQLHGGNADADALWKRAIANSEKKGGLA
jgi:hypothetical protein